MNAHSLSELSSSSLTTSISELRGRQRIDDVQFLWLLAEIDRRASYAELGFASLWDFCTIHLRLSSGAAGRRIGAARLLARFPAAADFLSDGRLGLTTFGMLKDLLTEENHAQLLADASLKSERQIDELIRVHQPLSFTFDTVIRTVSPAPVVVAPPADLRTSSTQETETATPIAPPSSPPESSLPPARIRAVDAEHVSLTLRVSKEFMADLEQVSAALSHIVPGRKPADVLRECMLRTLDEVARRRGGLPARRSVDVTALHDGSSQNSCHVTPAPGVNGEASATDVANADDSDPRAVPIELARAVWERDENSCTFVGTDGRRCCSTHQLQLHHRVSVARGGKCTFANLTLHCRRHNFLEAQRDLGADFMRQFTSTAAPSYVETDAAQLSSSGLGP